MIWFLVYILCGAVVGVLAGMLGIGGGMTLVPVIAALFAAQHFAPDHVVHLALGTAMASIVFTSAAGAREHYRLGSVDLAIVKRMAPAMAIGSLLSTLASGWISQRYLAIAFGIIVLIGATQILLNKKPKPASTLPGPAIMSFVALLIGIVCGLVSAGGAFMVVPFLLLCGVPMRTTIGTAALTGIPVAMIGTVGFMISGWNVPDLPSDAIGFVSLIALAGLVCGSVVTAPIGARLAHRMPVIALKRIFALLLYVLAIKMLVTYG